MANGKITSNTQEKTPNMSRVKYSPKILITRYLKKNVYFNLKGEKEPEYQNQWPDEFLQMFNRALERKNEWCKINNVMHSKHLNIIHIYAEVFRNFDFGSNLNKRTFFRIINIIATRSKNECIFLSCLSSRFQLEVIPWLKNVSKNKPTIMQDCMRKLLNEIVIPLFNHFYKSVLYGKYHQIRFYPGNMIEKFIRKGFNKLRESQHIIPVEANANNYKKSRGQLVIKPKNELDPNRIRPILHLDRNATCYKLLSIEKRKAMNKQLFAYAYSFGFAKVDCFYTQWKNYVEYIKDKKLYAVKLDLTDCYGSINLDKLVQIIEEIPSSELNEKFKNTISMLLKNNYVHNGSKNGTESRQYWEWKRGLLQGDFFSGPLCEIYLAYHENLLLREFDIPDCFLYRKVDDYLFCSTEANHISRFIDAIESFMTVNKEKSEIILEGNKECVAYCGKIINMKTKEITIKLTIDKNTLFHNRFRLWNHKAQLGNQGLLAKSTYYPYNNFYFQKLFINLDYNSKKVLYKNFFYGMVYIAHKLDSTVMSITLQKMNRGYETGLLQAIENCVTYYSHIAANRLEVESVSQIFKSLVTIGYNAFILVLKKRSLSYSHIISELRVKANMYYSEISMEYFKKLPKIFKNINLKRKFSQHV